MAISGNDAQGSYLDTGCATVPTARAAVNVTVNPPVVVDTGTKTTKTPVAVAIPRFV